MRKNNHLMLAYVLFLFLASIIGGFLEEARWNAIVCGATIASYFFAFSDYFYHFKSARDGSQEIDRQCGEMTISSARITRILLKSVERQEIENHEFVASSEKIYKLLDECTEFGKQWLRDAEEESTWAKKCSRISNFLSVLGFLAFLCVTILFPSLSGLSQIQNALTISAFAIIALTQYLREEDAQRVKKQKDYIALQKRSWEEIEAKIIQEEPAHAD